MASKKFYKRVFLNPKEGVAAYEARYTKQDGGFDVDGNVKISDCNHTVNLEFGWYNSEGKKNAEKKLATLIKALTETQTFLFPKESNA